MKLISGKEFCSILDKKGWKLERIKGSHYIYGKQDEKIKLSIPAIKIKL
jgi:predicted RNA binding protein YcfA (HicA-like mRNA interferase family)